MYLYVNKKTTAKDFASTIGRHPVITNVYFLARKTKDLM